MADPTPGSDAEPSYMRFFPFEAPYENQRAAMRDIHTALDRGRDVLFEGACGTGKTIAALVPALEYARATDKTVVITTNVHQQMRQFIADARAINDAEPIRAVVFRGKASMCHIDVDYEECQVLRDTTHDRVDLERDKRELEQRQTQLLERARDGDEDAAAARQTVMEELDAIEADLEGMDEATTCSYYYNNLTADTDGFRRWLFEDVRTPDEVFAEAESRGLCGYEFLKDAMEDVDLVVCNYRHLLDPAIRLQFLRWLDRDPEDVVAVFDEAHNIEAAARDHAARTCTERTLEAALEECREHDGSRAGAAANVIEPFRDALVATYEDAFGFGDREAVGETWTDVPVENDDRRDDLSLAFLDRYTGPGYEADLEAALAFGQALDRDYEEAYRRGESDTRREAKTLQAAAFIEAYLEEATATAQYPVVSVRRDAGTGEVYGRAELYACLPRPVTRPLFADLHASVLMSATLRPFDVTADVLGLEDPTTMAYGLTFPEANRRTFAVDTPPLFASARDDPDVQETVTRVLEDAIAFTPGNTLAFFPSYAEADRYADRVDLDGELYRDEPGTRAQTLRERFEADDGAALFTSLWGTLTEGVSFDGDAAHTVVVVGVPYPHLDDRLEAVQAAYADAYGDRENAGWEYAVEIPTVRKTRQALGRVLRAPEEIGVRVLADRRYTAADMGKYGVRGTFPPEEREELIDVAPEKLRYSLFNFYSGHDAWGGPESRPEP